MATTTVSLSLVFSPFLPLGSLSQIATHKPLPPLNLATNAQDRTVISRSLPQSRFKSQTLEEAAVNTYATVTRVEARGCN
ncbi:hypothetical protein RIF29_29439 [Crotalaria pallida]|uniref:Uncharacterized protein n=1 Tax=Crotalaria pallida TaxID=3830 RepID=A0AAN9EFI7_CROPI